MAEVTELEWEIRMMQAQAFISIRSFMLSLQDMDYRPEDKWDMLANFIKRQAVPIDKKMKETD